MNYVNNLQEFREKMKLSQAELASLSGMSKSGICRIEAGKRQPALLTARKIASALNTTVDVLFPEPKKHSA